MRCPRVLGVAVPWQGRGGLGGAEGEPASAWTAVPPCQMSNEAKPAQFHHFIRVLKAHMPTGLSFSS